MEEKKKIMEEIADMATQLKKDDLQKLRGVIIGLTLSKEEPKAN